MELRLLMSCRLTWALQNEDVPSKPSGLSHNGTSIRTVLISRMICWTGERRDRLYGDGALNCWSVSGMSGIGSGCVDFRCPAWGAESGSFRIVNDDQVGTFCADQHAADRGVEPVRGNDGPAAQRHLARPQSLVPMVRHADGRQDNVILRPLQERPLAVGRLRGSPRRAWGRSLRCPRCGVRRSSA